MDGLDDDDDLGLPGSPMLTDNNKCNKLGWWSKLNLICKKLWKLFLKA